MLRVRCLCTFVFVLLASSSAFATEPFRFPEARHGKGELRYISGVPVLVVTGTPEEIGEQVGILAIKPAAPAVGLVEDMLKTQGVGHLQPILARLGEGLMAKFPDEYRREITAASKVSGIRRELFILTNTLHDLRRLTGCSTLLVDCNRSTTGSPLVARNLDYPFLKGMHQYSLVTVYRPIGKKAFAVVSFPGCSVVGCAMSAMNSDGLVFGQNDVGKGADNSKAIELGNTPTAVLARRILEECSTVSDVEKFLRVSKPAGRSIFFACDRQGGAIFEVTPKTLVVRRDPTGVCEATNHFQSKELSVGIQCRRASILAQARQQDKLGVNDLTHKLHEVHLGSETAHTMVFEPGNLTLHVSFGDGEKSATTFPMRTVNLAELLIPR